MLDFVRAVPNARFVWSVCSTTGKTLRTKSVGYSVRFKAR